MSETETRWLGPEAAARYLSVRVDALSRLVKAGRIPAPNKALGGRYPRWGRMALDATFNGGLASTNPQQMVQAYVEEIRQKGRARAALRRGGRHD